MIIPVSFQVILLIQYASSFTVQILSRSGIPQFLSILACAAIATRGAHLPAVPDADPDHVLLVPIRPDRYDFFVD